LFLAACGAPLFGEVFDAVVFPDLLVGRFDLRPEFFVGHSCPQGMIDGACVGRGALLPPPCRSRSLRRALGNYRAHQVGIGDLLIAVALYASG
jgi:hypothetical protein